MGYNTFGLNSRVARRLLIWAFMVGAVGSLAISIFQFSTDYRLRLEQVDANLRAIGEIYTPALVQSVWALNREQIDLQLKGLSHFPDISVAQLRLQEGIEIRFGSLESTDQLIERSFPLTYSDNEHRDELGILTLIKDFSEERRNMYGHWLGSFARHAVIILFTALTVTFLFQTIVTRRLLSMAARLRGVSADDLRHLPSRDPLEPVGVIRDEIDELAASVASLQATGSRALIEADRVEARLRTITDSAHDAILMMDPDGAVSYWNPAAEKILGYACEEALGKSLHDLLAPDRYLTDHRAALAAFRHTGRGNAVGKTIELFATRKDGEEIMVALSLSAVSLDGAWHAVGILRDISEIKRYQAELRNALLAAEDANRAKTEVLAHLEELVASRTAELKTATLAAEAASEAKSAFLANMSHEIRTPMNAVMGFAHLLKDDPLSLRQLDHLSKLSQAARHLLQIINDILDISKIEAHKMTLETEDFEPARTIDQVCAIVAEKVAEQGMDLLVDLDHIPPVLRGDGLRFRQVLLNLVSNAVKFTQEGRITIVGRIVSEESHGITLRFEVRDTGIGMTEEQLGRLFEAFQQADGSTTRRFGGTGLGLAISKRLVELMNGHMGVESEFGRGTVFWLEIPFERGRTVTKTARCAPTLKGVRALVADGLEDSRVTLAAMLSELGMRVDSVDSAEAGLASVVRADGAGDAYVLLIIDRQMPGMDGIHMAARLSSLDLAQQPAYVLLAAYENRLSREEAQRAGITRVLAKPVTPSVLHDALEEMVFPSEAHLPSLSGGELEGELVGRRGASILLVEDNGINQEVGRRLLESLGMRVNVAGNGQMAVEMVRTTPYDLILMDVQMPVMDGLSATEAIRRLPHRDSVPIVAMTANAFDEDRNRCLLAGMNDHIAKPVELEKLHEALIKWLPVSDYAHEASNGENISIPADPGQAGDPGVLLRLRAIDGLDVSAGLKLLRRSVTGYVRMLEQFVLIHENDAAVLSRQAEAGECEALGELAHSLKGVAGTLGARRIHELALELEQAARRDARSHELQGSAGALAAELTVLLDALRLALPGVPDAPPGETVDRQWLAGTLEDLESLLAHDDTSVNDLFHRSKTLLMHALGDDARKLGRHIEDFNYDDALQMVHSMRKNIHR